MSKEIVKEKVNDAKEYLDKRKVKIDLKWFLVTVSVAFILGAILF